MSSEWRRVMHGDGGMSWLLLAAGWPSGTTPSAPSSPLSDIYCHFCIEGDVVFLLRMDGVGFFFVGVGGLYPQSACKIIHSNTKFW